MREALEGELRVLEAMVASARDEATSAESKAENKYDTRALEASYLAAGQGVRLAELRTLATWLDQQDATRAHRSVGSGALVTLHDDTGERWVLLGPAGGHVVTVSGTRVALISAGSPLGLALAGLEVGDEAEVPAPGGVRTLELAAIR